MPLMHIPSEEEFSSVGFACTQLQRSPQQILEVAERAGIKVSMYLNGVPHFDAGALEKISTAINEGN